MKRKESVRNVTVLILLLSVAALILFLIISSFAPYKYTKDCFYSNKEDFEQLSVHFRDLYSEGVTKVKFDENTDYFSFDYKDGNYNSINAAFDKYDSFDKVKSILSNLREQYQKDSDYPVFSSISVKYDDYGNMLLSMQAKKERLKNGDGIDSPDIRVYYLVYIDENYNDNSPIKEKEPFYDNWYTWSSDTYSG